MTALKLPAAFYFKQGQRGVLLLHAYSGTSNDMRMLGRFLEKNHYSVYAPMFSGHGTWQPEDILKENPQVWLEDVEAAITFMKQEGFQQIAVFGLSMGGVFALNLLAQSRKEILGGGAFASPLFFQGENQIAESFKEYSEKVLNLSKISQEEREKRLTQICQKEEKQLQTIQVFAGEVQKQLTNVKVPVLLAQGGEDQMILPSTVYETAQALKETEIYLHWYPKCGHVLTVGEGHQNLARDVVTFLNQLPWMEN